MRPLTDLRGSPSGGRGRPRVEEEVMVKARDDDNMQGGVDPDDVPDAVDDNDAPGQPEGVYEYSIRAAAIAAKHATDRLHAAVTEARAAGLTWHVIGTVLGITRQAAHERFSKKRKQREERPPPP